jgi:hypothetical protein
MSKPTVSHCAARRFCRWMAIVMGALRKKRSKTCCKSEALVLFRCSCLLAHHADLIVSRRMSFLKNTLKDDKHSQYLVDNIMCGLQSVTYPQFLQIFGHDPLPSSVVASDKKRPMTSSRAPQRSTATDSYKNYMFAQVPNCSRFEPLKGAVAVHPMVRLLFIFVACIVIFLFDLICHHFHNIADLNCSVCMKRNCFN